MKQVHILKLCAYCIVSFAILLSVGIIFKDILHFTDVIYYIGYYYMLVGGVVVLCILSYTLAKEEGWKHVIILLLVLFALMMGAFFSFFREIFIPLLEWIVEGPETEAILRFVILNLVMIGYLIVIMTELPKRVERIMEEIYG